MSRFLTLIRRDMADNRGALVITPLVVAGLLLVVTLLASFTGNARFGFDPGEFKAEASAEIKADIEAGGQRAKIERDSSGRVIIIGPDGQRKDLNQTIEKKGLEGLSAVLPVGTAFASMLPLLVAGIAVLFVTAGSLHDERKDRTILFWKSMPVSDLQTVGAKMTSIVGVGLFFALGVSLVLHLAITAIAMMTLGNVGLTGLSMVAVFMNVTKIWAVLTVGLLAYICWALPVYGWFILVSAWVNKMPFVAAFAPLFVVPLVYMAIAMRGDEFDPILQALWDPAGRLIGEPVFDGVKDVFNSANDQIPALPIGEVLTQLSSNFAQPMLWVGLVIAAGFIYAASEVRRRRAL
ncbi:MAG: hypothetical protein RL186_1071 [Pseudomonadota bacterium]